MDHLQGISTRLGIGNPWVSGYGLSLPFVRCGCADAMDGSDGDGAPAIQSDGKTCFRFNRAVSCYRYEYLGMLLLSMLAYYSSGH